MAKLFFRYGAMGSSKTANAIMVRFNYLERGQKCIMLKPRLDTRDGERVVASRSGLTAPCYYMEEIDDIDLSGVDCLIVDEAQFLTPVQVDQLMQVTIKYNIPVMAYGLRLNFRREDGGFEGATRLLQIAHDIEEIKTICECGKKATYNARFLNGKLVADGPDVLIDDGTIDIEYRAICPACYEKYLEKK